MAAIPGEYMDLLQQKPTFAHLATIMPNGAPQVTPVWFDYTNGKIRVNSAERSREGTQHAERRAGGAFDFDPENPYCYIQIRGRVEHVTRRAHRRTLIPLPRNTSGRTSIPGPSRAGKDHF